jgi:hypothetical protein
MDDRNKNLRRNTIMAKIQLKHKEGALHIGGGRFFYANEPVEVTEAEKDKLLLAYEDLEEVVEEAKEEEKPKTKSKKDEK